MKIFVTGFHRAGTHTFAEETAKENGLLYLDETKIHDNSLDAVKILTEGLYPKWEDNECVGVIDDRLKNGFVLQCPFLAHKILWLKDFGDVYWCDRDSVHIVTAMKNGGFINTSWDIMIPFRDEFPDDPIWNEISYDGSVDVYYNFVGYMALVVKVKNYFLNKYFKDDCTVIKLEDQSYYDYDSSLTSKKPLTANEHERVVEVLG